MSKRKVWVVEISGEVEVHASSEREAIALAQTELSDVGNFHFEAIETDEVPDDESDGE